MKLARSIAAAVLIVLITPAAAIACQCMMEGIDAAIERCHLIFRGRAVRYEKPGPRTIVVDGLPRTLDHPPGPVRWYFVPTALWKGEASDTILVYSNWHDSACGLQFPIGEEFTVFAWKASTRLQVFGYWPEGADSVVAFTTTCEPGGSGIPDALGPAVWEAEGQE